MVSATIKIIFTEFFFLILPNKQQQQEKKLQVRIAVPHIVHSMFPEK